MEQRAFSKSKTTVLLSVGLLLSIAASARAQDPPTSEFDVPSELDIHYIDRGDGGDDPMNPGCHWHFGEDSCSAPEFFFMGDYCSGDGTTLIEWTNNRCHEPEDDTRRYDCNEVCQETYGVPGSCVVARKHCRSRRVRNPDGSRDSASCVCEEEAAG